MGARSLLALMFPLKMLGYRNEAIMALWMCFRALILIFSVFGVVLWSVPAEATGNVVELVLDDEQLGRKAGLIVSQLETHRLRVSVRASAYRTGQGSTESMLRLWQRTEDLAARCQEQRISQVQTVRELEVLLGENDSQLLKSADCLGNELDFLDEL